MKLLLFLLKDYGDFSKKSFHQENRRNGVVEMKAKWGISLIFGILASILTYCFSIVNNTWLPSLFRAVIGFFLFAMLGFSLRFVLLFIAVNQVNPFPKQSPKVDSPSEALQENLPEEESNDEPVFQRMPLDSLHKK
jgi:hypothetical protein